MPHRSRSIALGLLVVVVTAGCGDDKPAGDKPERNDRPPEFARDAEAICKRAQRPIDYVGERTRSDALRPVNQVAVSNRGARDEIAKLERLEPPPSLEVRWKEYLDAERALLDANRKFERATQRSEEGTLRDVVARVEAARAEGAERGVDANVAAIGAGLGRYCTKVGVQARLTISTKEEAATPGEGLYLPTVRARVKIPRGWGPKYFRGRNTQAFDSDDGEVYCAFIRQRYGDAPGDGSESALLKHASEQADLAREDSDYRLISTQPEEAVNARGVSIRRVDDGKAGRVAFFFRPPYRYVVDCNTDEERFEEADREAFEPVVRNLTLPE